MEIIYFEHVGRCEELLLNLLALFKRENLNDVFFCFIKFYIHRKARVFDRFVGQISVETNIVEEVLKDSTKMGLINLMFGHLVCGSSRELFSILIGTKYEPILIGMIH